MRALPASSRGLRPNGSVRLVEDDLAVGDLRRSLEDPLELLVAHPLGCDTSRLVGLRRGVEEADRAHHALAGVDQEVAAEARQLAQPRRQTLADLLRQSQTSGTGLENPAELSCSAQARFRKSKGTSKPQRLAR